MEKQKVKIIGILVGIGLFIILILSKGTTSSFMSVRYFDENKKLINPTLSTVDNIPNMTYIDITIKVTNNGNTVLICDMIDLKPILLNNSMTKTTQTIPTASYRSWVSRLINITSLQSPPGNKNFNATVRCSYNDGSQQIYLTNKVGGVNVSIAP